jgi:hypothetical protein
MHQQLWGYKVEWKSVSRGTGGEKVEYHWCRALNEKLSHLYSSPRIIRAVKYKRAVWKVRGLTLLLRVGTLWRCGDGLIFVGKRHTSYNTPPTSRKRAADRWSLGKFLASESSLFMVGKAQKSHMARSDLNSVFDLEKWIGGTPSEHLLYSPDVAPCDFWAFPTMKMELRGKKFRSDQRSAARFREVGGSL